MKKYLAAIGAVILVLALASISRADWPATFKSWGMAETNTYAIKNLRYYDDDRADNYRVISQRARIWLQYGDPKTVRAVVGLEMDGAYWGEYGAPSAAGASGSVSAPGAANRNHMMSYGGDNVAVEIKHAYLDFTIPNTPVSLTTGLQNVAVGGYIGRFFMNNDVPGIKLTTDFAPHKIELYWMRGAKQDAYKDNDEDIYMARYLLTQKMFSVEAFFAYMNDRRAQTEAWSWAAGTATAGATPYTLTQTVTARTYEVKPWYLGLYVPVTVANLKIEPTVIYLGGKAREYFVSGQTDIDYKAWLADLVITYRIGPGMAVAVEGYYTSGDDTDKSTEISRYTFYGAGNEARYLAGNGKSVFFFNNSDFTNTLTPANVNPTGLWFARVNFEYAPIARLLLQFNYLYIGDTNKGSVASNATTGATRNSFGRTDEDVDNIGQEINIIANLKIYDTLRYMIGFGYFFPGDAYKGTFSRSAGNSPADNGWALLTNLRFAF